MFFENDQKHRRFNSTVQLAKVGYFSFLGHSVPTKLLYNKMQQ